MKKSVYALATLVFCVFAPALQLMAQDDETIAFIEAINKGEIEKVQELLDSGSDPNLEFHNRTPLMMAIWSGNVEIFKLLIEHGALITKKAEENDPLLNLAASEGNNEICEYLLSQGVNMNEKDSEGKTPLMNAIYGKHTETAKMLIDAGAHVNEQELNGWTALMFAVMHGDIESVKNLIEAKADVNVKTHDGETPLKRAKLLQREKVVELLVAAGAH